MSRTPQVSTPDRPAARRAKKATKKKPSKKKVAKKKVSKEEVTDIMTHVSAARCNQCFDILYSRHTGDTRWCSCRASAVRGGPDNGVVVEGADVSPLFNLAGTFSRKKMRTDWENGHRGFGCLPFPNSSFRHLVFEAFPASFGSRDFSNDPTSAIGYVRAKISLVPPRSVPEGAPTALGHHGAKIWEHRGTILGKLQMEISSDLRGVISSSQALVKLMDLKDLAGPGRSDFRAFRLGWNQALQTFAQGVPQWWENPPAIHELLFMDVLTLKSVQTEGAYKRSLLGKRRIGKIIPSIINSGSR